jgi:DNA-binding NarL/FixJ family response regulator
MLIDLRMAPMNGLELLWELNRNSIRCRALVFVNSEPDQDVFESIEAGAVGWLCKNMSPADILKGILAAAAGESVYPSTLSPRFERKQRKKTLTAREVEVLNLVSKGLSNKEVANVLGLSQFTIRNRMKRICAKLDASDRTEASTTAMERGIIRY